MEGAGHDSVGAIKSFFDTITMMNININIKDASELSIAPIKEGRTDILQQLKNGKNNVINVAEAGSFRLLGMMKTSRPVDDNIRQAFIQSNSSA